VNDDTSHIAEEARAGTALTVETVELVRAAMADTTRAAVLARRAQLCLAAVAVQQCAPSR
jgi:hypothetical protein